MTDLSDAVENADLSALLPFVRSPDDLSFMKDAVYSLDEIMYTAIIENWNEGLRLLLIFSNVDVNAPYMNTEGISKIYSNPLECAITKKNEVAVKLILGRKDLDVDRYGDSLFFLFFTVFIFSWFSGKPASTWPQRGDSSKPCSTSL